MILGGVAFIIILLLLEEPTVIQKTSFTSKLKRIDFLGTLFVIFFVGCLLIALNFGQSYGLVSTCVFQKKKATMSHTMGFIIILDGQIHIHSAHLSERVYL